MQNKTYKVYKIRNIDTGEYCLGGLYNCWHPEGQEFATRGGAKCIVTRSKDMYPDTSYTPWPKNVEIVEFTACITVLSERVVK